LNEQKVIKVHICFGGVMSKGSLIVVGMGIQFAGHATTQTCAAIKGADKVVYLAGDPAAERWVLSLSPNAESLDSFYEEGMPRSDTYERMTEHVLIYVRMGLTVCLALYGHPGVFVTPSHEAVLRARKEGHNARMLPAVSAADCLFADLGINPGAYGCQSFEATDFLIYSRHFDSRSLLVLWQVGAVGELNCPTEGSQPKAWPILLEVLSASYPPHHPTIVYEASPYSICLPRIQKLPLRELADVKLSSASTLCILPSSSSKADQVMLNRLGLIEKQGRFTFG
jgi:Tetrapyrrole (Corrin/Porphyrin) Methylases